MKKLLLITLLAILSTSSAYAEGGRGHGWGRGGGWGGGWGWRGGWIAPALIGGAIAYDLTYPYPVYASSYPVYEQPYTIYTQPAPVYVQPAPGPTANAAPAQYWYFCAASNAYYPYVSSCPNGWQAVPMTPPGAPNSTQPR